MNPFLFAFPLDILGAGPFTGWIDHYLWVSLTVNLPTFKALIPFQWINGFWVFSFFIHAYHTSTRSGRFRNTPELNNPTYEFFPPKTIHGAYPRREQDSRNTLAGYVRTPIPSRFLNDTLNANHYPIMFLLPDGTIFVAANQEAMILDWQKNTETRLPSIPNGVRIT